jgi:predicted kinase
MNLTAQFALLMCGPSLAGKSTLVRELIPLLDASWISADAINAERGLPFGAEGLPESVWAETMRIQLDRIEQAGRRQQAVILDDTCCYRWLRDRLRATCHSVGLKPVLLVLRIEWGELQSRHAAESATAQRPVLSLESLARHFSTFEWPDGDELQIDVTGLSATQVSQALRLLQPGAA